ncbi:hypothetical protein FRC10_010885 [Ceratobasidium sp. 414]|nr:hypothetical protein FRC10_010885 [Ceratobasidium sp. 414]
MSTIPKIIYGTACEDLVGEALTELHEQHGLTREQLFIQTKYTPISGHDISQAIPYDPSTPIPTQIRTSFARSLANLRTSWLDSYILHSPLDTPLRTKQAWSALCDLRNEGVVKRIGLSNTYDVETLRMLHALGKIDVVQNRWYEGNAWDREVVAYCLGEGIVYDPLVKNIAKAKKCTEAQVVYRLAQSVGIVPLAGSANERHMKDGVEAENIDLGEQLSELKTLIGN